jgi:phenylalanyl-tRNA synthetase beta chain
VQLLIENSSAQHVATVVDGEPIYPALVTIDPQYVSKTLGFDVPAARVAEILRVVGCDVDEKSFTVDPPSWRPDLLTAADFTEEVARMIGNNVGQPRISRGTNLPIYQSSNY